ncbi:MAG: methylenetetrahydrofolate reductase [Anaerolineales bacterium]
MKSDGRLERVLRSGQFAVTAELNPPDSSDPQVTYDRAARLADVCDAINTPDASGATVHLASLGLAALLAQRGYDVVMQLACRDRNRIALQGELLAAAALGVHSVLCLTGDGLQAGDHPQARPVFDLDSIQLLNTARIMRDHSRYLSGRTLDKPPRLFLGAAENPFAPPYDFRPLRLAKKVEAGADFFQLQFCFDLPRFEQFMRAVRELGLHERAFILAGVGPLRSVQAAEWMRSHIPGVVIPDEVIRRLQGVPPNQQLERGKRLCVEIIQQLREIPGVHGVHIMAFRHEALAAEIIEEAGLLPRPR